MIDELNQEASPPRSPGASYRRPRIFVLAVTLVIMLVATEVAGFLFTSHQQRAPGDGVQDLTLFFINGGGHVVLLGVSDFSLIGFAPAQDLSSPTALF
jgi:hypothetical protein